MQVPLRALLALVAHITARQASESQNHFANTTHTNLSSICRVGNWPIVLCETWES